MPKPTPDPSGGGRPEPPRQPLIALVTPHPQLDPQRVQEVFAEAAAMPTLARGAYFAKLRTESHSLADEVASLLRFHERERTADAAGDPTLSLPATLVGSVIAGCRVERLLGFGGMSAVYAAAQDFPRRRVAVKIVRRERIGASAQRRLRVEAEALARLEHPNIARVYAAGTQRLTDHDHHGGRDDAESPYIVMELIEGALPISRWANDHRLDARARIELVATIAGAIEHAHRAGVIHRDLKPGNVIVGADGTPKVIDFGIAAVRDSTVTAATEGPMGTLAYMSPEQARGQSVDTRSDVWGLGALLYDLLAGAPPFDAGDHSVAAHVDRLLHDTPAPVGPRAGAAHGTEFAGTIPAACDAVLRKALANDAEHRYRSASELADELRRLVDGEPLIARPDGEWDAALRLARRHRPALAAAGGILSVIVAALAVSLALLRRESEAHARAQWSAYVASISAASSMLDRGDASAAREMLDSAPEEHRGWEWSALERMSSQSKWAVQYGRGQQVYDTEWTADGTRIIAAASSNAVAIDRATGREVWRVPAPSREPTWRLGVMADDHVVVRMRDHDLMRIAPDGTVVARGTNPTITDLATDGSRTLLFGNDIGGGQQIDPTTLAVVRTIRADPPIEAYPRCVAASPDAGFLVLGGEDGTITAISTGDGKVLWSVRAPVERDHVRAVAVSHDGRSVAAAARSGLVLIEATDGEVRWRTTAAGDYRNCTFTPDGREVVGSNWNESVDRFDAGSGALKASIVGAYGQVWSSAVSPDGREIASGTFAARVEVFDAHATSRPEEIRLDGSAVVSVAAHGPRIFAATADGGLFALDAAQPGAPRRLAPTLHANAVRALPSGELAVAHDRGIAWLADDGAVRGSVDLPSRALRVSTLDRGATTTVHLEGGRLIALASDTGAARWSVGDFKADADTALETAGPDKVFLPRGTGANQALLEIATMRETPLLPQTEYASCGALSPDRRTLAIGSLARAGELALVDGSTLALIALMPNHRGAVRAVAWSPDSTRVASASADGTVRVWHAQRHIDILTAWRGSSRDLAWAADGTLWIACDDGMLRAMRVRD